VAYISDLPNRTELSIAFTLRCEPDKVGHQTNPDRSVGSQQRQPARRQSLSDEMSTRPPLPRICGLMRGNLLLSILDLDCALLSPSRIKPFGETKRFHCLHSSFQRHNRSWIADKKRTESMVRTHRR